MGIAGAASTSSVSSISSTLVNAQSEIAKLKENLHQDIHKQVIEKCSGDKGVIIEQAINTIVTEIYDAISLDYSSKFANIEKMLKGFQAQITALENRIEILEYCNDDLEQEIRSNVLLIHGLSQIGGETLPNSVLELFNAKMEIRVLASDIKSTEHLRTRVRSAENVIPPVLVTFHSSECAKRMFMNKKKLARSKVFISEYLTPKRKQLLNLARDKFGAWNVWTDGGRVLAKLENSSAILKIRSLNDLISDQY